MCEASTAASQVAGGWGLRIVDLLWAVCVWERILKMWQESWIVTGKVSGSLSRSLGFMLEDRQSKESFHFTPSCGQFCTGTNQGVHLGVHLLGIAAFLFLQQLHCLRNV